MAACIDNVGIGFLFAPKLHPAMKHAIGPRRELGVRTIFNVLGPLTNPADAQAQVIGVYDPELTEPIAQVLGALGSRAAFVVHGSGRIDELTHHRPEPGQRTEERPGTHLYPRPVRAGLPAGLFAFAARRQRR